MGRVPVHTRLLPALFAATALTAFAGCQAPAPNPNPSSAPTETSSPSATPTPDPTRPPLADLALGPDGFEQLPLGVEPGTDPTLSLVSFDAAACGGAGVWNAHPAYPATGEFYGPGTAFTVTDFGTGSIGRIDLNSADIPTDEGIRIGSSRDEVETAYPVAAVQDGGLVDIYVVTGRAGLLQIEVAKTEPTGYWEAARVDRVQYIHATTPDQGVFSVAASGNVLGVCQV